MISTAKTPHLHKVGNTWELLVDGKPYLILGAELHNSSMSSAHYMDTVWQNLTDMGINTVLGSVTWEDIEPEEGRFDFHELDAVIAGAVKHNLRLIILWFGSFKNGRSSYAPSWVKTNPKRFPRMYIKDEEGKIHNSGVLSIFNEECYKADGKAFTKLLQHLRDNDKNRTVIMVQVENEVGLQLDSRDRSAAANKLFDLPVPAELVSFLQQDWDSLHIDMRKKLANFNIIPDGSKDKTRNWEEQFGQSIWTDELFMAYYYARYVEHVASTGRKQYNIPLFTNAWLPRPGVAGVASGGGKPGEYPSGGPVSTVLDVWQKFAPSMDFFSPDIYHAPYSEVCGIYSHRGQPLFIPEQRRDEVGARSIWISIGTYKALGTSPFGIDTQKANVSPFTDMYKLLGSVANHILKARRENRTIVGFAFEDPPTEGYPDPTPPIIVCLQNYVLTIGRAFVFGKQSAGYGMVMELEPSKFLLIGKGFQVEWKHKSADLPYTEILRFEEKSVDKETGELRTERTLNGDESNSGQRANMPSDDPDYGEEIVPVHILARTAVAELELFSLGNEEI
ncbi:hypothetical protein N7522_004433 [Penicillium canescens]|nr:hypothetical protein N7522_004433 [Penicillium canescens]